MYRELFPSRVVRCPPVFSTRSDGGALLAAIRNACTFSIDGGEAAAPSGQSLYPMPGFKPLAAPTETSVEVQSEPEVEPLEAPVALAPAMSRPCPSSASWTRPSNCSIPKSNAVAYQPAEPPRAIGLLTVAVVIALDAVGINDRGRLRADPQPWQ
jgi:hypothetical protein